LHHYNKQFPDFYFGIRNSEKRIQSYQIYTRDCLFNPLYLRIVDLFLPYVNTYILFVYRFVLQEKGKIVEGYLTGGAI